LEPTALTGSSTVVDSVGTKNGSQITAPPAVTPRRYCPTGHVSTMGTCTAPGASFAAVMLPVAN
jgi:hypothetical protein